MDIGKTNLTPDDDQWIPGMLFPDVERVTSRMEFSRVGSTTHCIEDDGDTCTLFRDGLQRVISRQDAEGNAIDWAYDDAGNVIEMRSTDTAQVAGITDEVFLTTFLYDSLGRTETVVDNLGQATFSRFDSRGNLVAMADGNGPLSGESIGRRGFEDGGSTVNTINDFGNVTLNHFDGQGRPVAQEIILTASGLGDGTNIGASLEGVKTTTPTPDTSQGGGDGILRTASLWDKNSQLVGRERGG